MLSSQKFYGGTYYHAAATSGAITRYQGRVHVFGGVPSAPGTIQLPDASIQQQKGGPYFYILNISGGSLNVVDMVKGTIRALANNTITLISLGTSGGVPVWFAKAARTINTARTFTFAPARSNPIGYTLPGLTIPADPVTPPADDCVDTGGVSCTPTVATSSTIYATTVAGVTVPGKVDFSSWFVPGAIGKGQAGRKWRIREAGSNIVYPTGDVSTDGTLSTCVTSWVSGATGLDCASHIFYSYFLHAGFLLLEIGCDNGVGGTTWP